MAHRLRFHPGMMTHSHTRARTATRIATVVAALTVLLWTGKTSAGDPYTHDGLHFRWGVGVTAVGGSSADTKDRVLDFTTVGLFDGIQIGGYIKPNLSLFLEADFITMLPPNQDVEWENPASALDDEMSYGLLVGPGLGRYLMPANVYISGSVGATLNNFAITDDEIQVSTENIGVGFSLMTSKEWWLSEDFSMGFAGQFLFMTNIEGSEVTEITVAGGMLLVASHG